MHKRVTVSALTPPIGTQPRPPQKKAVTAAMSSDLPLTTCNWWHNQNYWWDAQHTEGMQAAPWSENFSC